MAGTKPLRLKVCGLLNDVTFHMSKCCAEDLHARDPKLFPQPDIQGMLEFEWHLYRAEKKKEMRGEMWAFSEWAIATVNDQLIGGPKEFLQWAEQEHNFSDFRPLPLYETLAEEAYKNYLNGRNHDYVYMEISIADKDIGRIVIELFSDAVPKTCENFKMLCTGEKGESTHTEYKLHYENSIFHSIVKKGWILGGDIHMKKGDGGESIYGPIFEDENFAVPHNRRGIIGMGNKGRHTNGSQFYITLQPAKWMDHSYVAFGQIIEGTHVLSAMEEQNTMNNRPMKEIKITDSGVCTYEF